MRKHSSMTMLIELAQEAVDTAAKQMQQIAKERDAAQAQTNMLHEYRQDYALRLQQATSTGLSASNYHNFRRFIATLDDAISQQNKFVAQLDAKLTAGREQWLAEKRRLNSYEALQARERRQWQLQENRREQRASDEFSANLYRRLHTAL